ncbi:MAG: NAD(P)-dependent oxidoreductase [Actinomycetota bacterium]
MTRVGFVGLGQIGRPMAERLDAPVVYDLLAQATDGFADVAASAGEVAQRADVISVMVRDDAQVRDVVREMLPVARRGTVIAIHSTISPGTAEDLAGRSGDVHVVDAPVSGGFIGASEGTLAVMVGGSVDAVDRCREPFGHWATLFVHVGGVGAGTKAKLARNLMHFVAFTAAGEAQRLAEAASIDLSALAKVVRHSDKVTGGPGAIMFRDSTKPVVPDDPWFDVLNHTAELGEKDLRLALELGEELGVDLPFGSLALEYFASSLGVKR